MKRYDDVPFFHRAPFYANPQMNNTRWIDQKFLRETKKTWEIGKDKAQLKKKSEPCQKKEG